MKSIVMKSIYTGLGLLGNGKETVEEISRKLAKKVNLSEKDGEKIAHQLRTRSEKAISAIQKTLDSEVNKVVSALHTATKGTTPAPAKKRKTRAAKSTRSAKRKTHSAPSH